MNNILNYDIVDSTQDEAKRLIQTGAVPSQDVIICAKEQLHGRGRRGRSWDSRPGNLYISVVTPKIGDQQHTGQIAFVAAIALQQIIGDLIDGSHNITCKWPNDILIDRQKVGGILIETEGNYLIIGVGVNVQHCPSTGVRAPATSLSECSNTPPRIEKIIDLFYNKFNYWKQLWIQDGFAPIRQAWLEVAHGLGQQVSLLSPDASEKITGIFSELDFEGSFVLKTLNDDKHISVIDGWHVING